MSTTEEKFAAALATIPPNNWTREDVATLAMLVRRLHHVDGLLQLAFDSKPGPGASGAMRLKARIRTAMIALRACEHVLTSFAALATLRFMNSLDGGALPILVPSSDDAAPMEGDEQ